MSWVNNNSSDNNNDNGNSKQFYSIYYTPETVLKAFVS